jgi:hypothetical protein
VTREGGVHKIVTRLLDGWGYQDALQTCFGDRRGRYLGVVLQNHRAGPQVQVALGKRDFDFIRLQSFVDSVRVSEANRAIFFGSG